jgi:hypothetical protein
MELNDDAFRIILLTFFARKMGALNVRRSFDGPHYRIFAQKTEDAILRSMAGEALDATYNVIETNLNEERSKNASLLASVRPNVARKEAKTLLLAAKEVGERIGLLEVYAEEFAEFLKGWKSNAA